MSQSPPPLTEELVDAFVDGQLDPAQAAQVAAALEAHPALALRAARQRELRALLQRQFAPVLEEPVPLRLQAAATGARPRAARRGAAPAWRAWGALAASLMLGVLLGLALRGGVTQPPYAMHEGTLVARGALGRALTGQLSQQDSADVVIGLSLRTPDGRICRSFSLPGGEAGLACREGERWRIDVLTTQAPATEEYRQASSRMPEMLRLAIESRAAGPVLSDAEETALRDRGWREAPATPD